MSGYDFLGKERRAICTRVVDGDTMYFYVDEGKHFFSLNSYRMLGWDAFELRRGTTEEKALGRKAKELAIELLQPRASIAMKDETWNIRIITEKDPDNFGRWLADIYCVNPSPTGPREIHLGTALYLNGLAVPYEK